MTVKNGGITIALAKEHEFLNEEALAYELCGEFYLSTGQNLIAKTYLQEARILYQRWGANAKVEHLQRCHPQLLSPDMQRNDIVNLVDEITPIPKGPSANRAEITTETKASGALSH